MSDRPNPLLQIGEADPNNPLVQGPTWADAYRWHAQNLADTMAALKQPQTWLDAANQYRNALLMGSTAPGIRAFHGSPYDFERFDIGKIGTGEGAQAYGHGLYFAEHEPVAQGYRDALSGRVTFKGEPVRPTDEWSPQRDVAGWLTGRPKPDESTADWMARRAGELQQHGEFMRSSNSPQDRDAADMYFRAADKIRAQNSADWNYDRGKMYEVNIGADPEHMLDWDKPLEQQSSYVQEQLKKAGITQTEPDLGTFGGMPIRGAPRWADTPEQAKALWDAGIPGIRYLDQGSRAGGEGTSNYVVFNDNIIDILRKYGIAGLIGGGGAAAIAGGDNGPPVAQ